MRRLIVITTTLTGATGSPWLNTFRFQDDATQTDANDAHDLVSAFWTSVATRLRSSIVWAIDSEAKVVGLDGVQTGAYTVAGNSGGGGQNDDLLPPAVQALITWRTGSFLGGRELRGRTFVPGYTEGASGTSGTLTGTSLTNLQAAAAALAVSAANRLVIWSRASGAVSTVSGSSVATKFATLRSRRD